MNPNDGRLKLVASCVVALWLMLVGQRADAVTVVPANPTITVGQNQQFGNWSSRHPHGRVSRRVL